MFQDVLRSLIMASKELCLGRYFEISLSTIQKFMIPLLIYKSFSNNLIFNINYKFEKNLLIYCIKF